MLKVLFVCLGNICRSPMAEGSFKKMVHEAGLDGKIFVDSAGTSSYHIGEDPDERMTETAKKHQVFLRHKARQLSKADFSDFDYIIAMDSKNFQNIKLMGDSLDKKGKAQIFLMREFDSSKTSDDVPDPYFGALDGFEEVYQIVTRSSKALLDHIIREHKLISN